MFKRFLAWLGSAIYNAGSDEPIDDMKKWIAALEETKYALLEENNRLRRELATVPACCTDCCKKLAPKPRKRSSTKKG